MTNSFVHHSHQNFPPFQSRKNQTSKTHFFQKWKKQEESFLNMNRSMAQQGPSFNKVMKKYSFQHKNSHSKNKVLVGSCKTIERQKTVPKSRSTNLILKQIPINQAKKFTRKVPKSKSANEVITYQWRASTHFPVVKVVCVGQKQISQRNSVGQILYQLELQIPWIEDIKFYLPEISQFSLLNSLYIIDESLVSFQRLYNKFGFFEPTLKMIFITNGLRCKIWSNQNFWQNIPLPPKFVSKQHQKVEYFYKKIIKMFDKYFKSKTQIHYQQETIGKSINLIQKLMYELQRKSDFVQGMKFINQFLNVYSLKINNKFIYPVQVTDNRSRIFTKLQNSYPEKITTLEQIPIKNQQSQKQDVNVKTLKNSIHKYKQVIESNVRTIIDKKSSIKQKQVPFKKQSQISICSKQTIVEKKSRFSLHDEKQPGNELTNHVNNALPNFTNQDFNQEEDEIILAQPRINIQTQKQQHGFDAQKINDQEQYQEKVRNEIEKHVRQRNGWLQSPQLFFDTDDCAKSFQDSQPSVKIKNRDRKLTKLNRIKSSIANSIVE